jgi:hypothetical protein
MHASVLRREVDKTMHFSIAMVTSGWRGPMNMDMTFSKFSAYTEGHKHTRGADKIVAFGE